MGVILACLALHLLVYSTLKKACTSQKTHLTCLDLCHSAAYACIDSFPGEYHAQRVGPPPLDFPWIPSDRYGEKGHELVYTRWTKKRCVCVFVCAKCVHLCIITLTQKDRMDDLWSTPENAIILLSFNILALIRSMRACCSSKCRRPASILAKCFCEICLVCGPKAL